MAQIGSKHIRVKVDAATGAWKVKKDNTQAEPDQIDLTDLQSTELQFVGVILHSHSSPG